MSSVGDDSSQGRARTDREIRKLAMKDAKIVENLRRDGFEFHKPGTFREKEGAYVRRLWEARDDEDVLQWRSTTESICLIHNSKIIDDNGRNPSNVFLYAYYEKGNKHAKLRLIVVRFRNWGKDPERQSYGDMSIDSYMDVYGSPLPVLTPLYFNDWEKYFHEDYQHDFHARKTFNFKMERYILGIRALASERIQTVFNGLRRLQA